LSRPDPQSVAGRNVRLVHPWALREPAAPDPPGTLRVGVLIQAFHARWPWSERRWRFVLEAMAPLVDVVWWCSGAELAAALAGAQRVRAVADPHLASTLSASPSTRHLPGGPAGTSGAPEEHECFGAQASAGSPDFPWESAPSLFPEPGRRMASFSAYWREVSAGVTWLSDRVGSAPR
jgi:deoxyribodipyrimidine photo-lyase